MKSTTTKKKSISHEGGVPSQLRDARRESLGDWRGKTLSGLRALIQQADPEVVEERKWRKPSNPAGVPVWSHDGIICTGETYKNHVRLTFAKGASLKDQKGLFNASLEGNALRAIVIHEGDEIDEEAFRGLVRAAVALNASSIKKGPKARARSAAVSSWNSEKTPAREARSEPSSRSLPVGSR